MEQAESRNLFQFSIEIEIFVKLLLVILTEEEIYAVFLREYLFLSNILLYLYTYSCLVI